MSSYHIENGIPDYLKEDEGWKVLEYTCPVCKEQWEDAGWSSVVDANCPKCDARDISPVNWEPIEDWE